MILKILSKVTQLISQHIEHVKINILRKIIYIF